MKLVFSSYPGEEEAEEVARAILQNRLAACVWIIPASKSLYWWKGEIEESRETVLIAKTKEGMEDRLLEFISSSHPYEVPEIAVVGAERVHPPYREYLESTVRGFPSHPMVGVSALIEDEGKVLLVKRGAEPGKGCWSLPGGLVELGEDLREACAREVEEETGLKVEPEDVVSVQQYVEGGIRYHYVLLTFKCRPVGGELRPGSDAADARWFGREEAMGLRLTDTTRRVLEGRGGIYLGTVRR